jgi:hypothetical protein
MGKNNKQREPLPEEFTTLEEAAEFWDTHSLADYEDLQKDVEFEVEPRSETNYFAVEKALAEQNGLINWLNYKVFYRKHWSIYGSKKNSLKCKRQAEGEKLFSMTLSKQDSLQRFLPQSYALSAKLICFCWHQG